MSSLPVATGRPVAGEFLAWMLNAPCQLVLALDLRKATEAFEKIV